MRRSVSSALKSAAIALAKTDVVALSTLSEGMIRDIAVTQDDDAVSVAVLVYALSKVSQHLSERGNSAASLIRKVTAVVEALEKSNDTEFAIRLQSTFAEVRRLDSRLKLYVQEVLSKARIKKASSLHGTGISVSRAAELMGISQWELMSYVGKTIVADTQQLEGITARRRLQYARDVFS